MLIKNDREIYINIKEFFVFFILRIKNKSKILSILFLFLFFGLILLIPFDFGLSKKDLKRLNILDSEWTCNDKTLHAPILARQISQQNREFFV